MRIGVEIRCHPHHGLARKCRGCGLACHVRVIAGGCAREMDFRINSSESTSQKKDPLEFPVNPSNQPLQAPEIRNSESLDNRK